MNRRTWVHSPSLIDHLLAPVITATIKKTDLYEGKNWKWLSTYVRNRARWTCQECGRKCETPFQKNQFHTHHKRPWQDFKASEWGNANKLSNLRCLCKDCHRRTHGR